MGETGLFSGQRVSKCHPLVVAYGTVDELTSHLGVVLASNPAPEVAKEVRDLQHLLFELGADLTTLPSVRTIRRISSEDVLYVEQAMDRLTEVLPPLRAFILPGGALAAAHLQLARTVCRRAERETIFAAQKEVVSSEALILLNRISDYLFLLGRYQNFLVQQPEPEWHARGVSINK